MLMTPKTLLLAATVAVSGDQPIPAEVLGFYPKGFARVIRDGAITLEWNQGRIKQP